MRVAICDDEKIFREEIKENIYSFFGKLDCVCLEFAAGEELLSYVEKEASEGLDAVFLDIEMGGLDGLETAASLRRKGLNMPVIFLTSHTELAMEGYEVSAFRFCGKPLNKEKIEKVLHDLQELLFIKKRVIIRFEGEEIVLNVDDIIYVEAMNNSIRIVTAGSEYIVRKKLSDFLQELEQQTNTFVKIHRGYLVNLVHARKLRGNEVLVSGEVSLPISRSMVGAFKERLFEYVRNSAR